MYGNSPSSYQHTETGELIFTKQAFSLLHYFAAEFLRLAKQLQAQEFYFPSLLPIQFLQQIDYLESFPHLALFTAHFTREALKSHAENWLSRRPLARLKPIIELSDNLLSRALCYHFFYTYAGKKIPHPEFVATAIGRCFRHEDDAATTHLRGFLMREIIFLGKPSFVEEVRQKLLHEVSAMAKKLQLCCTIDQAHDPFFGKLASGKLLLQKLKPLKYELSYHGTEENPLAIASFNNHQDFFTTRLDIQTVEKRSHSGCVAFGIERWVIAFLQTFGEREADWPKEILTKIKTDESALL